jgi:hypothetical protein
MSQLSSLAALMQRQTERGPSPSASRGRLLLFGPTDNWITVRIPPTLTQRPRFVRRLPDKSGAVASSVHRSRRPMHQKTKICSFIAQREIRVFAGGKPPSCVRPARTVDRAPNRSAQHQKRICCRPGDITGAAVCRTGTHGRECAGRAGVSGDRLVQAGRPRQRSGTVRRTARPRRRRQLRHCGATSRRRCGRTGTARSGTGRGGWCAAAPV